MLVRPVSSEISNRIYAMSFLGAVLVAAIHVGWEGVPGSADWWCCQVLCEGFGAVAVPFFFSVSGFFLAGHLEEDGWWRRELGKRFRTLFIPYWVWLLIAFAVSTLPSLLVDLIAHRPLGANVRYVTQDLAGYFGLDLTRWPGLVALWYLRALVILVVCSPVFCGLLRKFGRGWLAVAFAADLLFRSVEPSCPPSVAGFFRYGFPLGGVFWFSLGIFIRFHAGVLKPTGPRVAVSLVFGVLLWAFRVGFLLLQVSCPVDLRVLYVPLLLYGLFWSVPPHPLPMALSGCAFPLFVAHGVFYRLFVNYASPRLAGLPSALTGFVMWVSCVISIVAGVNVLRSRFPGVASFLFSGRT